MVPAARAAKTGHAEHAPQKGEFAIAIFRGDALHIKVAAIAAMSGKHETDWDHPTVEAALTSATTPRAQSSETDHVIERSMAARTPATF